MSRTTGRSEQSAQVHGALRREASLFTSVATVTQLATGHCPRETSPPERGFGIRQCCSPRLFLHVFAV